MHCAIYICKFGVVVCKASMFDWGWGGVNLHGYMCIVLYISASRSAKFGVVVCKASMLVWGSICHRSMLHHYTSPAN